MESKDVGCNLCNSDEFEVVQEIQPYKIVRCKYCQLLYLNPQPLGEEITKTYTEDYYSASWGKDIAENKFRLKNVERFRKGGRLLDVGCGIGAFLKLARQNGWQVSGLEVSEFATKYVNEELNIECFLGSLENLNSPSNSYDVITLWHVIEHMRNPLEALKKANRLLSKKGMIFLATPNQNFWEIRISANRRISVNKDLVEKERHLHFFAPHSLKKMMGKAGFKVVDITVDFNKGKPKLEHFLKYYLFLFLSRAFRINISKSILVVGKK